MFCRRLAATIRVRAAVAKNISSATVSWRNTVLNRGCNGAANITSKKKGDIVDAALFCPFLSFLLLTISNHFPENYVMAVNSPHPISANLLPIAGVDLGYAEAGVRKADRKDLLVIKLAPEATVAGVF